MNLADKHNAAAMREALEAARDLLLPQCNGGTAFAKACGETVNKIMDALSAPPRNCDVGTAKEQAERYGRYCDKFTLGGMHCETCPCCGKIPFGKCEFAWAELPYEKGSAK